MTPSPVSTPIPSISYGDFSLEVHRKAGAERVIRAQMELTYRCNLHCRHCYTDPYNDKAHFPKEMTFGEITRILDEMADAGILWLNLTGGEVFSRKDFFDIYDYAYAKGFLLVLYSNGTTITESVIDKLTQKPPFYLDISCHAATEAGFDWFTQVSGSFRRFERGLALLKASGLPFRLKSIPMNSNKEEWPQVLEFVKSFGVRSQVTTQLFPRLNGDLGPLALRLSPQEMMALDADAGPLDDDDCAGAIEAVSTPASSRLYRCTCATTAIHVNAWAELGTCTFEQEVRASLREYSLTEAIDRVFGRVRALRYETDSPCRACVLHSFCQKKPTPTRMQFQDPEAPSPHDCDVAFLKASHVTRQPLIHPLQNHKEMGHDR